MPINCGIPACKAGYKKNLGLSLFELPSGPPELRDQWVKNICVGIGEDYNKPPEWIFRDHTRICSKHFDETEITLCNVKRRLLPKAVPTLFPGDVKLPNPLKLDSKRKSEDQEEYKEEYVKKKQKVYKDFQRVKKHHTQQITAHSLLYEPTVIIEEPGSATPSSSGLSIDNFKPFVSYRDIAVQVQVVEKSKVDPEVSRLKALLRNEKKKNNLLQQKIIDVRKMALKSPAKDVYHEKLDSVLLASQKGDMNAIFLLEHMQQFTDKAQQVDTSDEGSEGEEEEEDEEEEENPTS